jgi:hypothetical protein
MSARPYCDDLRVRVCVLDGGHWNFTSRRLAIGTLLSTVASSITRVEDLLGKAALYVLSARQKATSRLGQVIGLFLAPKAPVHIRRTISGPQTGTTGFHKPRDTNASRFAISSDNLVARAHESIRLRSRLQDIYQGDHGSRECAYTRASR